MLKIAIRDLQRGPVDTDGEVSPSDPVFAGLDLPLDGPVSVEGQLQATEGDEQPRATNAARRRAEQLGIDLSTIEGTGSGGLITIKDVTGS